MYQVGDLLNLVDDRVYSYTSIPRDSADNYIVDRVDKWNKARYIGYTLLQPYCAPNCFFQFTKKYEPSIDTMKTTLRYFLSNRVVEIHYVYHDDPVYGVYACLKAVQENVIEFTCKLMEAMSL